MGSTSLITHRHQHYDFPGKVRLKLRTASLPKMKLTLPYCSCIFCKIIKGEDGRLH